MKMSGIIEFHVLHLLEPERLLSKGLHSQSNKKTAVTDFSLFCSFLIYFE